MKTKICSYAIIPSKEKYVLVMSNDSKKWNLPGGAKNNNKENKLEACLREVKEEIGIKRKKLNLKKLNLSKPYKTNGNIIKIKNYFFGKNKNYNIKMGHEVEKIGKFTYKELRNLEKKGKLKQGVLEAVKIYKKFYSNN